LKVNIQMILFVAFVLLSAVVLLVALAKEG
jgi:hypothetical protein